MVPAETLTLGEADRLVTVMAQPSRVDPQVIGYFDRLTEHYTADQILGPVLAQLDMLAALRRHAAPAPGRWFTCLTRGDRRAARRYHELDHPMPVVPHR